MAPNSITSIMPVRPEGVAPLRHVLMQVANPLKSGNPYLRFGPEAHFARFVLIPGADTDVVYPGDEGEVKSWRLLFCGIFDGDAAGFVRSMISHSPDLNAIFMHCVGFNASIDLKSAPDTLLKYLTAREHLQRPGIFYSTFPDQDAQMVRWQNTLRARVETMLSEPDGEQQLRAMLASAPDRQAALTALLGEPVTTPTRINPQWNLSIAVMGLLVALAVFFLFWWLVLPADWRGWVLLIVIVLLVGAGALLVSPLAARRMTRFGAVQDQVAQMSEPKPGGGDDYRAVAGTGREDVIAQNQFNLYLTFKPGRWRVWQMWLLMTVLQPVTRYLGYPGVLGGLTTVHFGHWVLIDGGRRLFFMTCYDGSWENYIADFVNKIADTLDVQLLNFVGFSDEGTRGMAAFRRWLRRVQIQSEVFYSAYPRATVRNIMTARRIVDTCPSRGASEAEIQQWLQLF